MISTDPSSRKGSWVGFFCKYPQTDIESLEFIRDSLVGSTVLEGDFNAHHPIWSRGKKNKLGLGFKQVLDEQESEFLADPENPTLWHHGKVASSTPDFMILSRDLEYSVTITEIGPDIGSDHFQ